MLDLSLAIGHHPSSLDTMYGILAAAVLAVGFARAARARGNGKF